MKHLRINRNEIDKYPKWSVGYGDKFRVQVPYPVNPRDGICDACGRSTEKGEIKTTHLHHWLYQHKRETVKKDPLLVLENLNELCFIDHEIADALRALFGIGSGSVGEDMMWHIIKVALLMPDEKYGKGKMSMKEKFDWVAKAWLEARKHDKKTRLEQYA